jgi:hypothetical protein
LVTETKIEQEVRQRISEQWPQFQERRDKILSRAQSGSPIKERDVEDIFQALAEGPLGYEVEQLSTQRDYADFALVDRGLKLAVVELKKFGQFRHGDAERHIEDTLKQASKYAERHRTPNIMAFDGQTIVFGRCKGAEGAINVHLHFSIEAESASRELYYLTHYGIFRYPSEVLYSFEYFSQEDEGLFKNHHGERLHHTCFAYVGDIRNKGTWNAPYRNADGSVDTKRLGHAVNFLLSPGGYRGSKASSMKIPVAATTLVALRLARAYEEIGKWQEPESVFDKGHKPDPQTLLWLYLYQQGLEKNV